MLIEIPALLSASEVDITVAALLDQPWVDGKVTAGQRSAMAKNNRQLSEDSPVAHRIGEQILARLSDNALFMSAALPKRIYPPLFNRYSGGEAFDWHIDNAIRGIKGVRERVRTDISATLFLADPASYDGGELVLTEQRPRMQSRVDVLPLCQGDAAVFAVQQRPVAGTRSPSEGAGRSTIPPCRRRRSRCCAS